MKKEILMRDFRTSLVSWIAEININLFLFLSSLCWIGMVDKYVYGWTLSWDTIKHMMFISGMASVVVRRAWLYFIRRKSRHQ